MLVYRSPIVQRSSIAGFGPVDGGSNPPGAMAFANKIKKVLSLTHKMVYTLEEEIEQECSLRWGDFIPIYGCVKYGLRTRKFEDEDAADVPTMKNVTLLSAYNLATILGIAYVANLFK